jgi:hypothetical protein
MSAGPVPVHHQAPPPLNLAASGSGSDSDNATFISDEDLATGKFQSGHPLFDDLAPQDSYSTNGTYWVCLPKLTQITRPSHLGCELILLGIRRICHERRGRDG